MHLKFRYYDGYLFKCTHSAPSLPWFDLSEMPSWVDIHFALFLHYWLQAAKYTALGLVHAGHRRYHIPHPSACGGIISHNSTRLSSTAQSLILRCHCLGQHPPVLFFMSYPSFGDVLYTCCEHCCTNSSSKTCVEKHNIFIPQRLGFMNANFCTLADGIVSIWLPLSICFWR